MTTRRIVDADVHPRLNPRKCEMSTLHPRRAQRPLIMRKGIVVESGQLSRRETLRYPPGIQLVCVQDRTVKAISRNRLEQACRQSRGGHAHRCPTLPELVDGVSRKSDIE